MSVVRPVLIGTGLVSVMEQSTWNPTVPPALTAETNADAVGQDVNDVEPGRTAPADMVAAPLTASPASAANRTVAVVIRDRRALHLRWQFILVSPIVDTWT
jgi:hypothetical protein